MATYRSIASSETDADSPVTTDLMQALADNPTAIAEGASGAPKIAQKTRVGGASSGSTATFNAMDDFGGVTAHIHFRNSGGVNRDLTLEASDDGSTWYPGTPEVLRTIPAGEAGMISFVFDFSTGAYRGAVHYGSTAPQTFTGTLSGASAAIEDIRFGNATDLATSILLEPHGGDTTV